MNTEPTKRDERQEPVEANMESKSQLAETSEVISEDSVFAEKGERSWPQPRSWPQHRSWPQPRQWPQPERGEPKAEEKKDEGVIDAEVVDEKK